jgi:extracellular elastinolytic metalloproteinase
LRKALALVLSLGLLVGVLGTSAQAGKKKKKPKTITFEAEGTIAGFNPVSAVIAGVTELEFREACAGEPASQGLDGYVVEIPRKFQNGTAMLEVKGANPTGVYDLDVYYYSTACELMEPYLTDGEDPSGLIPPGAAWAIVDSFVGVGTGFTLKGINTI